MKDGEVTPTFSVSVEAAIDEAEGDEGTDVGVVAMVLFIEVVMEGVVMVVVMFGVVKIDVVCSVVDFIVKRGCEGEVLGTVIFSVIVGFVVSSDTVVAEEVLGTVGSVLVVELLVTLGCTVVTGEGEDGSGVVVMFTCPQGMHLSSSWSKYSL